LAKPANEVTVADVIRAVEGPLASVRGGPPEDAKYDGAATTLPTVWIAVRVNLRRVVEHVTIADIANSKLPRSIEKLTEDPGAWVTR
jgi:DNA-binding IscR family transcriptional regulator